MPADFQTTRTFMIKQVIIANHRDERLKCSRHAVRSNSKAVKGKGNEGGNSIISDVSKFRVKAPC